MVIDHLMEEARKMLEGAQLLPGDLPERKAGSG